jgi:hypothetical protein
MSVMGSIVIRQSAVNGRFANIWSFGFHIFSVNYVQLCGIGTHCRLIPRVTIKRHQTE